MFRPTVKKLWFLALVCGFAVTPILEAGHGGGGGHGAEATWGVAVTSAAALAVAILEAGTSEEGTSAVDIPRQCHRAAFGAAAAERYITRHHPSVAAAGQCSVCRRSAVAERSIILLR